MGMTIGEVIAELKQAPKDAYVTFDFGGCVPTTVCSWRGSYDEPSIQWVEGASTAHTATSLIAELEQATSGKKYHGWKGGEYSYTKKSQLHVDNNGRYTCTEIARIESQSHSVIIHTYRADDS